MNGEKHHGPLIQPLARYAGGRSLITKRFHDGTVAVDVEEVRQAG